MALKMHYLNENTKSSIFIKRKALFVTEIACFLFWLFFLFVMFYYVFHYSYYNLYIAFMRNLYQRKTKNKFIFVTLRILQKRERKKSKLVSDERVRHLFERFLNFIIGNVLYIIMPYELLRVKEIKFHVDFIPFSFAL